MQYDFVIVGAGFAGCVLGERLASVANKKVLIIEKRDHIAGNAYDYYDSNNILTHKYGPHIFHTNSHEVFEYLSRFTEWRAFKLKVLASVQGMLLPIPINLTTVNRLYNKTFNSEELQQYFDEIKEYIPVVQNSEQAVVSQVGRDLYNNFYKGYTKKQWGIDASQLDKSVTSRIPVRTNTDDHYFSDTYQCMPLNGYTRMFKEMLNHENITLSLNTNFSEVKNEIKYKHLIYTGSIDEYFNYCHGKLPYRSLKFEHEILNIPRFQPVAIVTYPNDYTYTRITEHKHLTGQTCDKTKITYEFPTSDGDPYYPIPNPKNAELYNRYKALAGTLPNVHFVGRLGSYRYYNMDQVVAQALTLFKSLLQEIGHKDNNPTFIY